MERLPEDAKLLIQLSERVAHLQQDVSQVRTDLLSHAVREEERLERYEARLESILQKISADTGRWKLGLGLAVAFGALATWGLDLLGKLRTLLGGG